MDFKGRDCSFLKKKTQYRSFYSCGPFFKNSLREREKSFFKALPSPHPKSLAGKGQKTAVIASGLSRFTSCGGERGDSLVIGCSPDSVSKGEVEG